MLITVVCLFLFLDMLLLIQVILEEFILLHVKIGSIWINMQRDLQHCSLALLLALESLGCLCMISIQ